MVGEPHRPRALGCTLLAWVIAAACGPVKGPDDSGSTGATSGSTGASGPGHSSGSVTGKPGTTEAATGGGMTDDPATATGGPGTTEPTTTAPETTAPSTTGGVDYGNCGWDDVNKYYECGYMGVDPLGISPIACPPRLPSADDACDSVVGPINSVGCCTLAGVLYYCTGPSDGIIVITECG